MKTKLLCLLPMLAVLLAACEKKSDGTSGGTSEKVKTISATDITSSSALLTGQVGVEIADYKSVEYGMLISEKESDVLSYEGKKFVGNKLIGQTFSITANGLSAEAKYYYRAYLVLNAIQYEYGAVKSFKTEKQSLTPSKDVKAVDLGLSVKWANMNIGATVPEDYGAYFAWGETSPKTTYNWSTYFDTKDGGSTFIKYNNDGGKTVLDLVDDAAHVNWGGSWRMPTTAEQDELLYYCTWTWTTLNGINGYEVKGPNGNTIFLPASGCHDYSSLGGVGSDGGCWLSSLIEYYSCYAASLYFFSSGCMVQSGFYRGYGLSIRPVCQ